MTWQVHEWSGNACDFHSRDLPISTSVWLVRSQSKTIVLGSSQRDDVVDLESATKADFKVCKRRTGGGAVLVDETCVWVDVTLPRDHQWWTDDVSASMLWLGEAWAHMLSQFSRDTTFGVHHGAMIRSVAADAVCFAGRAPGEVFVGNKKIVGISQRRSREGARFQCALYTYWSTSWMDYVTGYDLSASERTIVAQSGCGLHDVHITASPEQLVSALGSRLRWMEST